MAVRPSRLAAVILGGLTLVSTAVAGRSLVILGKVLEQTEEVVPLGLTGRRIAFGVGVSPAECRVKLWSITKASVTPFGLPKTPSCTVETSTGTGIATVSVAQTRVAWLAFTGGNIREWSLFTATPASPKPQRRRFAARGVDGPPPIVLGPGTPQGIPYAVGREVIYLGDDGTRLFRVVARDAVRLVAAGPGPNGMRVVAVTASGRILALAADGAPVADDIVVDGAVKALRLVASGVAYQVGRDVHVVGPGGDTVVTLPGAATMVDAATGRILYQRAGDLGAVRISDGTDVILFDGSPAHPVLGQIDPAGLAWARGSSVFWRSGPLP